MSVHNESARLLNRRGITKYHSSAKPSQLSRQSVHLLHERSQFWTPPMPVHRYVEEISFWGNVLHIHLCQVEIRLPTLNLKSRGDVTKSHQKRIEKKNHRLVSRVSALSHAVRQQYARSLTWAPPKLVSSIGMARLPCWLPRSQQVLHHRWIRGFCYMQATKHWRRGSILFLKPRGDISRSCPTDALCYLFKQSLLFWEAPLLIYRHVSSIDLSCL